MGWAEQRLDNYLLTSLSGVLTGEVPVTHLVTARAPEFDTAGMVGFYVDLMTPDGGPVLCFQVLLTRDQLSEITALLLDTSEEA